jgi:hypothetical protein
MKFVRTLFLRFFLVLRTGGIAGEYKIDGPGKIEQASGENGRKQIAGSTTRC